MLPQPKSKARDYASMIELKSAAATLRFMPEPGKPGLYAIVLQGRQGASGTDLKEAINDAFAWMFINTDALVLRGVIDADNKQCLAMVPHTLGYRIEYGERAHIYTVTLARWAKAYGLEKALAEMRSSGQAAKADKLEAAARTAGALS